MKRNVLLVNKSPSLLSCCRKKIEKEPQALQWVHLILSLQMDPLTNPHLFLPMKVFSLPTKILIRSSIIQMTHRVMKLLVN